MDKFAKALTGIQKELKEMKTTGVNVMAVTAGNAAGPVPGNTIAQPQYGTQRDATRQYGGRPSAGRPFQPRNQGQGPCERCGDARHDAPNCYRARMHCHVCGALGHVRPECPNNTPAQCYGCGGDDHFVRNCPNAAARPANRYAGGDVRRQNQGNG